MSADNWAVCPRCATQHARRVADERHRVSAAYGNVPISEFDALRAEVEALASEAVIATFREDYEIYGADEGVVRVSYSGSCKTCGLSLSFTDARTIPGVEDVPA